MRSQHDRGRDDPPPLHELEAEVMDAIWQRGESSVRQVMETLNRHAGRPRAYTTYMTIMARLDGKGLLERRREGKTDFYRPRYTRDEYADVRARAELDSIVDQFGELALAHIARQMAELDPRRRRALERIARER
jgi:predicted transcriptional regulator